MNMYNTGWKELIEPAKRSKPVNAETLSVFEIFRKAFIINGLKR